MSIRKNTRRKKRQFSVQEYVKGILDGDRIMLGQAITMVESNDATHQRIAQEIIKACLPFAGNSIRIGITGTPGVGKSTMIESLGKIIVEQHQLAVLAIDPTSQVTRGSVLGDKTRMNDLSTHPKAFIRPSPAGSTLGGVARKTREITYLCEAAGYDVVLIETVGVGQSETAVHSMVDFFFLMLLPGGGDELQGIKRGVIEMADLIAINKAEGDMRLAKQSKRSYRNALHLFPAKESNWIPQVVTSSALSGNGVGDIWALIKDYEKHTKANQYFSLNRNRQLRYWLEETMLGLLSQYFEDDEKVREKKVRIESDVLNHKLTAYQGALELVNAFIENKKGTIKP